MNSEELQESYGHGWPKDELSLENSTFIQGYIQGLVAKATPLEMVGDFHETFGMPIAVVPDWVNEDRQALRLKLIEEEYHELLEGVENRDLENVAKELADMVYVIYGMALELGIDLDSVFEEVHRSNMSKVWEDGEVRYREDGKVLKPPTYSPADVTSVW